MLGVVIGALAVLAWPHSEAGRIARLRTQLASQATTLSQAIANADGWNEVQAALVQTCRDSRGIAWIRVEDESGAVRAGSGSKPVAASARQVWKAASSSPVFRLVATNSGSILVGVFPVNLPAGDSRAAAKPLWLVSNRTAAARHGVLEIAARLDAVRKPESRTHPATGWI